MSLATVPATPGCERRVLVARGRVPNQCIPLIFQSVLEAGRPPRVVRVCPRIDYRGDYRGDGNAPVLLSWALVLVLALAQTHQAQGSLPQTVHPHRPSDPPSALRPVLSPPPPAL